MPRLSGAAAVAQRVAILRLRAEHPESSLTQLANMMDPPVAKSTVQYVLMRFQGEPTEVVLQSRNDPKGNPDAVSQRWKRYVPCLPVCCQTHDDFNRHLIRLSQRNPTWSLRRLAAQMKEWELTVLQSRPAGAVFRVPRQRDPSTFSGWYFISFFHCSKTCHTRQGAEGCGD